MKDGKGRVVWDGSMKLEPLGVVMNDYTPTDNEPEVTFGTAKKSFYWLICNLRVSYPEAPTLLALADIKACFRFPRIHLDLTVAFGFLAANLYLLAIAMVSGSNTPAACWEQFHRAIEALLKKFANRPDLVEKHKEYIDMIDWNAPTAELSMPVRAFKCPLNPGVIDEFWQQNLSSHQNMGDGILIAAVGVANMKMTLAAAIEAIATLGQPNIIKRQCPLAMDK